MKKKIIIALISVICISSGLIVYAINKADEGTQSSETSTDIVATEGDTTGADATVNKAEEKAEAKIEENKDASTLNETTAESSSNVEANQGDANTITKESPDNATVQTPVPVVQEVKKSIYKDGTYSGFGEGLNGKVAVNVTISGDKITTISVGDNEEDAEYLESAKGVISKIISSQSTSVDTISGATFSSNGIINGVSAALSKAKN